jgi:protein phosphatase
VSITVDCFGLSDRGQVRRLNEDQFLIADLDKAMHVVHTSLPDREREHLSGAHHGKLLIVADGMGGRSGGEVASGVAVETVARYALHTMPWFFQLQDGREADLESELKAALEKCQRKVQTAGAVTGHREMGTTLTMAYLLWPRLYVVHAGDSRCYLFRNGQAHQITQDHTVAQRMIERGLLSPEEAAESRWSHALVKCVGGGSGELNPDVYKATLQAGDTLLLCTDGLSKYVAADVILEILNAAGSAAEAAGQLVDAANAAGGDDNITVVVARLADAGTAVSPTLADAVAFLPTV